SAEPPCMSSVCARPTPSRSPMPPCRNSTMAFINLDRRFLPWGDKRESAAELYAIYGSERDSLSWQGLLEKRRVVILAEAGSGKTEELKEQARSLCAEGKFAFYATVEDVATEGLDGA